MSGTNRGNFDNHFDVRRNHTLTRTDSKFNLKYTDSDRIREFIIQTARNEEIKAENERREKLRKKNPELVEEEIKTIDSVHSGIKEYSSEAAESDKKINRESVVDPEMKELYGSPSIIKSSSNVNFSNQTDVRTTPEPPRLKNNVQKKSDPHEQVFHPRFENKGATKTLTGKVKPTPSSPGKKKQPRGRSPAFQTMSATKTLTQSLKVKPTPPSLGKKRQARSRSPAFQTMSATKTLTQSRKVKPTASSPGKKRQPRSRSPARSPRPFKYTVPRNQEPSRTPRSGKKKENTLPSQRKSVSNEHTHSGTRVSVEKPQTSSFLKSIMVPSKDILSKQSMSFFRPTRPRRKMYERRKTIEGIPVKYSISFSAEMEAEQQLNNFQKIEQELFDWTNPTRRSSSDSDSFIADHRRTRTEQSNALYPNRRRKNSLLKQRTGAYMNDPFGKRPEPSKIFNRNTIHDALLRLEEIKRKLYEVSISETDVYDPYEHRASSFPTTNWQSLNNVIRSNLGIGVLTMPFAFKHIGLFNGVAGSILIIVMMSFCIHMLMQSQYEICKKCRLPYISFGGTIKKAMDVGPVPFRIFSTCVGQIVQIVLVMHQMIFVILHGKRLAPPLLSMMLVLPVILLMSIKRIKNLSCFSTLANLFSCIIFAGVVHSLSQNLPDVATRSEIPPVSEIPTFVALALYSMDSFGTSLAVEAHMKNPQSFSGSIGIFNISIAFSGVWFMMVGFMGYWKCGHDVKSIILSNLDINYSWAFFGIIVCIYILAVTIAVQLYLPVSIVWNTVCIRRLQSSRYPAVWLYLLRLLFALLPFVVAFSHPTMRFIIACFGVITVPFLELACPALIHICLNWYEPVRYRGWILGRDFVILILSILGMFSCIRLIRDDRIY